MGTLGIPEMMFIFTLALLLFGPKKLPELGRTVGKALSEFRRAQSELKATFDREMRNLERESESLKEATNNYYQDSYNYDHSYESSYDADNPYGSGSHDSTATDSSTASASATQGAESSSTSLHLTGEPPEGTVASGSYTHESSDHESNPYETSAYDNPDYENGAYGHVSTDSEVSSAASGPVHDLAPQHHEGESGGVEKTIKS